MPSHLGRNATWATLLVLGCSLALAADKVAELSDEFLEYLGSLESEDENWTEFTAEAVAQRSNLGKPQPVKASSSSSSSVSAASIASKADK